MAGVIMYPGLMKQKTQSMLQQLEQLKPYAKSAGQALELSEENRLLLRGVAWESVQSYMRDVQIPMMKAFQSWIHAQSSATKAYHRAACLLPKVRCLDEDRLEEIKSSYERWLDREYDREHPSYSRIAHYRRMIREMDLKLAAMRIFISMTKSLYDRPAEMLEILEKADSQLSGVKMEPDTGRIDYTAVSSTWLLELKWLSLKDEMLKEGLTETEIKQIKQEYELNEAEAIWKELHNQGIGTAELDSMHSHGYSLADVFQSWRSLETEGDKRFFVCLARGEEADFMKAFDIDPNELSDSLTFIMSDYACHLLDKDQKKELLAMSNALLSSERIYFDVMPDGSKIQSSKAYRDVYIEKLYAGTTAMLQGSAAILAGIMEGSVDGAMVEKRYHSQFIMSEFWSTVDIAIHRQGVHNEDNQYQIKDIEYIRAVNALSQVTLSYWSPWYGEHKTTIMEANQKNNLQLSTEWARNRMEVLEKQKEHLLSNYIMKAIQGGAAIAAGYVCPEVAILIGGINMAASGSAGTVYGADRLVNNEWGKLGIKGGNLAALNVINYAMQMNALMGRLDQETYKTAMEWFGSGSVYEIDGEKGMAFVGLYDPKLLRNMVILNNEGVVGLMGLDPKDANSKQQIDDWVKQLRISGKPSEIEDRRSLCRSILNGEYEFMNKRNVNHDGLPEYEINLNSEYFSAIEDLDNVLKNFDGYRNGIQNTFFVVDKERNR